MKNLKNLTVISAVMIVFLSSCQNNDPPVQQVYMNSYTKDFTVYAPTMNKPKSQTWQVGTDDPTGKYFYCEFQEPNLTQEVYDYGTMQAFLWMNGDNITPLPFDDFWNNEYGMWTEQVTCEFQPGYVTFILKYNDHTPDATPPDPSFNQYDFRVRFTW